MSGALSGFSAVACFPAVRLQPERVDESCRIVPDIRVAVEGLRIRNIPADWVGLNPPALSGVVFAEEEIVDVAGCVLVLARK